MLVLGDVDKISSKTKTFFLLFTLFREAQNAETSSPSELKD